MADPIWASFVRALPKGGAAVGVDPQTWHYGLVAQWWSEFNDDFRSHELPVICREKAQREGLSPNLYVQPMHELDRPRRYRTIFVCGSFGLGSNRDRDLQALTRFREHLSPGGVLVLDIEVPYADAKQWKHWLKGERASLPEAARPPRQRRRGSDGAEYALSSRIVEVDPLNQHVTLEMHAELWRDGQLEAEENHLLDIGLYFRNLLMLERAGFASVVVHGEHTGAEPTNDDDFLVFVART